MMGIASIVAMALLAVAPRHADAQSAPASPPSPTQPVSVSADAAGAASEQRRPQPGTATRATVPPKADRLGVLGYGIFGSTTLSATKTLDAVAGTHSRQTFGGGVQVTNIWKGIFADAGVSYLKLDGERVFVHNGQVFTLGIPLRVTIRPIDLAGGWRMAFGRVSPYVGAGITSLAYEETADFAQAGDDVSERASGALVIGGADVHVWRWVRAGAEVRYRRVRGILGSGGASAEFGEHDAGGVSAAFRIAVGR